MDVSMVLLKAEKKSLFGIDNLRNSGIYPLFYFGIDNSTNLWYNIDKIRKGAENNV